MKVYFTGSPRALKTLQNEHQAIFDSLKKLGHTQLSDFIITADPDGFYKSEYAAATKHYQRTMRYVKEAEVVIVEVSTHSMSLGFIVNEALGQGKQVIALYLPDHNPFFFANIINEKLQVIEYTIDNLEDKLTRALHKVQETMDTRFNFFIPADINRYLDWISQSRKLPRAVFIRNLLEKEMKHDKDYSSR